MPTLATQRVRGLRAHSFIPAMPRGQQWHPCDDNACTKVLRFAQLQSWLGRPRTGATKARWKPLVTSAKALSDIGCSYKMLVCI